MKQQENNMKTVTGIAWITSPDSATEQSLTDIFDMTFTGNNIDMANFGWLRVGSAEITLTSTMDKNDLVLSMIETQEAKIKKIQADAENEINNLRRKIMELQAITYEVPA
jgi:hypothetical protein